MSQQKDSVKSEIIAERLRQLREKKKLSLDLMAEYVGISRAYLQKLEAGKSVPTLTVAEKFADLAGENLNYFKQGVLCAKNEVEAQWKHLRTNTDFRKYFGEGYLKDIEKDFRKKKEAIQAFLKKADHTRA